MMNRHFFPETYKIVMLLALAGGLVFSGAGTARAQDTQVDPPNVHLSMPVPSSTDEAGPAMKTFQAICWYLPNRLMDLTDIFRLHIAGGDGMGASLRATKYLNASWFEDDTYCLGISKRKPPFFAEHIEERYFGFLAAQGGELDRDPTEVGISFHFIAIGANLAFSMGEVVDALTGIVGVDLAGDDHGPFYQDDTAAQREAEDAAAREYYDEYKTKKSE